MKITELLVDLNKSVKCYDTYADIIADDDIQEGQLVKTLGYNEVNDGYGAEYIKQEDGTLKKLLDVMNHEVRNKYMDKNYGRTSNWYGTVKFVNIIGDSITHGYYATNFYKNSWADLVKKALQSKYNSKNEGFVRINPDDNAGHTFHTISKTGSGWRDYKNDNNALGLCSMVNNAGDGSLLKIKPLKSTKFCVVYAGKNNGGQFTIKVSNKSYLIDTVNTYQTTYEGCPFFSRVGEVEQGAEIIIQATTPEQEVKILGIQYFQDTTTTNVMINNYARSGAKLVDVPDRTIEYWADCSIAFFSLGHNDSWFPEQNSQFTAKINKCIAEFKKSGTYVVVNDFCWSRPLTYHTRKELKRLADETNGLYIGYTELLYGYDSGLWQSSGFLKDSSHPTDKGMMGIYNIISEYLNLPQTSEKYCEPSMVAVAPVSGLTFEDYTLQLNDKMVNGVITIKGDVTAVPNGKEGGIIAKVLVPPIIDVSFYGIINATQAGQAQPLNCGFSILRNGDVKLYAGHLRDISKVTGCQLYVSYKALH